jgi:hypothetical protein
VGTPPTGTSTPQAVLLARHLRTQHHTRKACVSDGFT